MGNKKKKHITEERSTRQISKQEKEMFSLSARVHNGRGESVDLRKLICGY